MIKSLVLALLRGYQLALSPWLGNQCRFWPTCSHYAAQAVERHGVARGLVLAAGRLARCHPWHPGGVDPVPQTFRWSCVCRAARGSGRTSAGADGPPSTPSRI